LRAFIHQGNTLDAVRLIGNLTLNNYTAFLRIRNGLTLEGAALLENSAIIEFSGNQTWNSGELVFTGDSATLRFNGQLTLGPALVIRGKSGTIQEFGPNAKLINQGTIAVDTARGSLTIAAAQFDNSGVIKAVASGSTITIRSANFNNTGTIEELNGGKILINP
jgi:hypothetical protein